MKREIIILASSFMLAMAFIACGGGEQGGGGTSFSRQNLVDTVDKVEHKKVKVNGGSRGEAGGLTMEIEGKKVKFQNVRMDASSAESALFVPSI